MTILLIFGGAKLASGRKPRGAVAPPTSKQAVLEISTSPAGAIVVVNGKERDTTSTMLGIPLAAGPVQIEARLPGYQTARATANLHSGIRSEATLTLTPILVFKLLLPGDGEISVNDGAPVKVGGSFSREFAPGTYSVKVTTGRRGMLSFTFPVDSGPAVLTSLPTARDVSALLISNFGEQGRIYTSGPAVKVKLDGQALGELNEAGLDSEGGGRKS